MSEDIHKYPSQLADRFQVRMPDGLRDRIAEAAKVNNRSMNAEIVARLEGSFDDDQFAARLTRIEESIAELKSKVDA